jgi:hypothetical protein
MAQPHAGNIGNAGVSFRASQATHPPGAGSTTTIWVSAIGYWLLAIGYRLSLDLPAFQQRLFLVEKALPELAVLGFVPLVLEVCHLLS